MILLCSHEWLWQVMQPFSNLLDIYWPQEKQVVILTFLQQPCSQETTLWNTYGIRHYNPWQLNLTD